MSGITVNYLVEKQLSIQVEEKEIIRSEKQLTADLRLPADARAYQTRIVAEGNKIARLKGAEGEAQKIRLLGGAEAASIEAVSVWNLKCDILGQKPTLLAQIRCSFTISFGVF